MEISDFIPENRLTPALDAITAAFGRKPPSDWRQVSGGVSGAIILHFRLENGRYVLRLEPERISITDRERGYTCMTAAAALHSAPPVHYADPSTGIAIMDYVSGHPLSTYPGGAAGLVKELGRLISAVHKAPPSLAQAIIPLKYCSCFKVSNTLRL